MPSTERLGSMMSMRLSALGPGADAGESGPTLPPLAFERWQTMQFFSKTSLPVARRRPSCRPADELLDQLLAVGGGGRPVDFCRRLGLLGISGRGWWSALAIAAGSRSLLLILPDSTPSSSAGRPGDSAEQQVHAAFWAVGVSWGQAVHHRTGPTAGVTAVARASSRADLHVRRRLAVICFRTRRRMLACHRSQSAGGPRRRACGSMRRRRVAIGPKACGDLGFVRNRSSRAPRGRPAPAAGLRARWAAPSSLPQRATSASESFGVQPCGPAGRQRGC